MPNEVTFDEPKALALFMVPEIFREFHSYVGIGESNPRIEGFTVRCTESRRTRKKFVIECRLRNRGRVLMRIVTVRVVLAKSEGVWDAKFVGVKTNGYPELSIRLGDGGPYFRSFDCRGGELGRSGSSHGRYSISA